jgi:hypothetical protein
MARLRSFAPGTSATRLHRPVPVRCFQVRLAIRLRPRCQQSVVALSRALCCDVDIIVPVVSTA